MLELSNPASLWMLGALHGGNSVRRRANRPDSTTTTVDWRPGDKAKKGAQIVQIFPEVQEEPEGTVASPEVAAFVARASEQGSSCVSAPVPLPVRSARHLQSGYGGKDLPRFPLSVMQMNAAQLPRLSEVGRAFSDRAQAVRCSMLLVAFGRLRVL